MKLKLASALPANVLAALEDLIRPLYSKPGMRIVVIAEIAHIEKTEVAPEEDKEPTVTVGFKSLEVAQGEQVDHLQRAAHALYVQRTARGTLDEEIGELALSKHLLEGLADQFALQETARLRAVLDHVGTTLARLKSGTFTEIDMRKQTERLHTMVRNALEWQPDEDDNQRGSDILKNGSGVLFSTAAQS